MISYGTPANRFFLYGRELFLGLNLKYFDRGFSGGVNQTAAGYSGDFGMRLAVNPSLYLGLNVQNFLPISLGGVINYSGGAEEALASLVKIGAATRPTVFNRKVLIATDIDLPVSSTRPPLAHIGIEWQPINSLALRCGLDQSIDPQSSSKTTWDPAYGISLGFAHFRFDYAYHPFYNDPSLANNYFSFSYAGEPSQALRGKAQ
ncbi:hypothetical protein A2276_07705 [candidate division WOR-1 bacterium RIFOXYA12_FULL_43_27]|uniref:Type IX secretion system membrane protein PorP/SprF n=1 Tax=candidate division WOR-1 bacterium RIFOXYC2_FULL_46_14 TaxID=1802587 RepID=A0A1F4U5T5_UNCSA|nr:MAG: hypothetical protein A2276_07705 [candidate division WOR-1 bacterium RIFOXYA12_FULL_43_27]OGC20483.1 MAG: hypothetical protein A2292_05530 [candidate division WOR-1 bacterium RIFOXYB2_FULL_46_45]OGC31780.1 MAG: hypothetical protein A2232_05920 [candidate division WOR-1 bacterium RIFOXYA2_FULL_46_56]OGC40328.1 MAG: hypothetical protein A2438_03550 [candidate division WOR-1 bacterium RIFOXYC2_FULL_46_14]